MTHPAIIAAEDIAEHLLFPRAMETDASPRAPLGNFEALAEAGLYGLAGPAEYGGADLPTLCSVIERLAAGCLTTNLRLGTAQHACAGTHQLRK